jgi:hypothetical protein
MMTVAGHECNHAASSASAPLTDAATHSSTASTSHAHEESSRTSTTASQQGYNDGTQSFATPQSLMPAWEESTEQASTRSISRKQFHVLGSLDVDLIACVGGVNRTGKH